jgi:superfamily II DNA or RNA helicase
LEKYSESVIIGFSATPDYLTTVAKNDFMQVELENGQSLYAHPDRLAKYCFGELLDRRTIRSCIEDGWLSPLAWGSVSFDVSLDSVPVYDGVGGYDYQANALKVFMDQKWSALSSSVRRLYKAGDYGLPDSQAFAVCPSVSTAEELASAISDIGIPAAAITGRTPTGQRHEIFSAYTQKKIKMLTSVMVLREGWDAPQAEVCLMLRPTRSRVVYVQTAGRVLRPGVNGTKKTALVLDGRFENTRFAPLTAPSLFAPVGSEMREGDLIIDVRYNAPGPAVPAEYSPYVGFNARRVKIEQIPIEFR